jgi:hypothetical protein
MASLRAVQVNDRAAEDLDIYFNELRDDQVICVNPCDGMPVERIMQITAGQRAVVVADLEEPLPVASRAEDNDTAQPGGSRVLLLISRYCSAEEVP